MKLSVLVPSIRTANLEKLYWSVVDAYSGDFEFIIISPYEPPSVLMRNNVKFIQSWRSPCACQQQGLLQAEGEYVAWLADDGLCIPGAIDESFRLLDEINEKYKEEDRYKTIIVSKYHEGNNPNDPAWADMVNDEYYFLRHHASMQAPGVPIMAMLLCCGLISRKLLLELGGWDAEHFQALPLAYNDFSIRAGKYGANFVLENKPMFKCSHMPNETGDHKPIHIAQTFYDQPVFNEIHKEPTSDRMIIPLNNWEKSEEVWKLRFKEGV